MSRSIRIVCIILGVVFLSGLVGMVTSCIPGQTSTSSETASGKVFGNRIPMEYFVTSGQGDTDIGPGDDPWETGAYDLALLDAKLANFNVIEYTSVLPPEVKEVPLTEAEKSFHHGAVIETIMASANGVKGNILCTGVGRIQISRKSDEKHIGGFAAEYEKVYRDNDITIEEAKRVANEMLHTSLMGIVNRRYSSSEYEFFSEQHTVNAFKVEKSYGTSLVALCWISHIYPSK